MSENANGVKKELLERVMRDISDSELPKCEGHHLDQPPGDDLRVNCLSGGEHFVHRGIQYVITAWFGFARHDPPSAFSRKRNTRLAACKIYCPSLCIPHTYCNTRLVLCSKIYCLSPYMPHTYSNQQLNAIFDGLCSEIICSGLLVD